VLEFETNLAEELEEEFESAYKHRKVSTIHK
jgi:hypothetical protein